jgi:uncharacterized protein (DUF2141 family)
MAPHPRATGSVALPTLVGALALAPLASGQSPAPPPPRDVVVATVTGLRNDHGEVRMMIYDGPTHWPHSTGAVQACHVAIHQRQATCVFQTVRPGATYAIALSHDENDNGRFDTNFLGMPTEGYGFSNDARPTLSAPSFDRCRFVYRGGEQAVRMVAQY